MFALKHGLIITCYTSNHLDLFSVGESVSVIKHTDPVPDPRAVNQDKKNMLFSVRTPDSCLSSAFKSKTHVVTDKATLVLTFGHVVKSSNGSYHILSLV